MTHESTIAPEDTILIIDDSPENLRVLSKTLQAYGYAVRCVTNGMMAFASIKSSPPDLILLDIRMLGMDGYEVCQQLKQNSDTKDIPVIFLSALDDVKDIVKAFQVGGVDYITKPFQTEEVLARIRNQLTIQNLRKQLFAQNQHLLQEIDERKKFEAALCQEIQRRTLIEASLQDAKNAAEAANYVKNEFLAQISHELRTPLSVILGFTTLMRRDTALNQIYQTYLAKIHENGQRLLKIINSILSLTHAESSQLSLDEQEFDLHHLLNSIVALWHPKVLEKGLQFEFYRACEVPQYIRSDESKLRQILMNLLDNAIQVTERGYVKLKVDVEDKRFASPDGTCSLIIEVQDTGKGIELDELNTVFKMFSQTEANQQTAQDLELGLLIIRQFAQLMNGNVVFQGSAEQGSTVRVQLIVQLAHVFPPSSQLNLQSYTVESASDEDKLTLEALQVAMPNDWLIQLHKAAVKGFDQQILQLIQKIPSDQAALANILEIWTRNFQFDRIIEITQHITQ